MARRIVARRSESSTKPCSRRSPKLVPWSTRCGGPVGMLGITLQDLRFRARQFLIAVVGAGLIFAMTLLLSGLAAGFGVEVDQTVTGMGTQGWVVAQGSSGRISSLAPMPATAELAVKSSPGVQRADPLIV